MFYGTVPKNTFELKYPDGSKLSRKAESLYLMRNEDSKAIDHLFDMRPLVHYFRPFDPNSNWEKVIMVRFGGLGDILALTPIMKDLEDKGMQVNFHTVQDNLPLFEWIKPNPAVKDVVDPLVDDFSLKNRLQINDKITKLTFEQTVENGVRENWYEYFYKLSGLPFDESRGRPLMQMKENIQSNVEEDSIILTNRSTSPSRSISIENMYEPMKPHIKGRNVYVYARNLNDEDAKYVKENKIKIIFRSTVDSFLNDIAKAGNVVTTDTASIHFREGIGKTAIGLYTAFTTESRVKHYKYINAFNLKNECPFAPCFLHKRANGKFCSIAELEQHHNAPCLSTNANSALHEQLDTIYKQYL